MDGVLGMALSPYRQGRNRYLFFHALASVTENVMFTSILRNESLIGSTDLDPNHIHVSADKKNNQYIWCDACAVNTIEHIFQMFPKKRTSQSAAEAVDRDGIMFFGLMDPPSIWCWNTATEFSSDNFHQVAIDRETLQFASGVKIVNNLKGEQELWVLTSSFQRVMTGSLSSNKINFRIHAEKIPILMANSPCRMQTPPNGQRPGYHANLVEQSSHHVHNRYGASAFL